MTFFDKAVGDGARRLVAKKAIWDLKSPCSNVVSQIWLGNIHLDLIDSTSRNNQLILKDLWIYCIRTIRFNDELNGVSVGVIGLAGLNLKTIRNRCGERRLAV